MADASATHGVALISLPALGAMQTRRRARDAVIRLVDGLVGESLETGRGVAGRRVRVGRRLAELAAPIRAVEAPDVDDVDLRSSPRSRAGTSATDRHDPRQPALAPVVRLSRALAAAAAAVALALVTSDLWKLSDALDWIRLLALMVLSVGATVLWLIVSHRLWERPRGRASREQTVLFNVATTLTLLLGAAFLYAALFAMTFWGRRWSSTAASWRRRSGMTRASATTRPSPGWRARSARRRRPGRRPRERRGRARGRVRLPGGAHERARESSAGARLSE